MTAAFLVDATGRTSNLVSKERYFTHRSSALYAYWEPTKRVCRKRMIVEFTANEWYWGCDLPNGSFNAMCFVEPSVLINKNEDERARLYDRLLKESKLLPQLVSRKIGKVHCCDASSSVSRVPIANNFIKVGEAAICIDPVSGQGLHFAILSGIQGAIVCHTILSDSSKRTAAMQFYQSQLNHWERIHTGLVPSFSRTRPEDFLSSTIDFRVKVKEEALPCVLNDSIEILPTLTHPRLGQGIAFINGLSVTNFIQLASPYTFPCLLDNWSKLLGDDVQARNLILKFLNMNLLKKIVS